MRVGRTPPSAGAPALLDVVDDFRRRQLAVVVAVDLVEMIGQAWRARLGLVPAQATVMVGIGVGETLLGPFHHLLRAGLARARAAAEAQRKYGEQGRSQASGGWERDTHAVASRVGWGARTVGPWPAQNVSGGAGSVSVCVGRGGWQHLLANVLARGLSDAGGPAASVRRLVMTRCSMRAKVQRAFTARSRGRKYLPRPWRNAAGTSNKNGEAAWLPAGSPPSCNRPDGERS